MQQNISQFLRQPNYLKWLAGGLLLSFLGVIAAWLPNLFTIALLAVVIFASALLMRPRWVLIILLLLRSSVDVAQNFFTLFPGRWYSLNTAGAFNIAAVGIGIFFIVRRLARGQDPLPSAPLKIFAGFMLVAAVGIFQSIEPSLSIKEWSRLAGVIGIALLVFEVVDHEKDLVTVLRVITLAAVPALLLGYYQAFTGTGYFFVGWQETMFAFRPQGTFGHPAILATFMILVSGLALSAYAKAYPLWSKPVLLSLAGSCLGLLVLTYARTEWIGALVALSVLGLLRYRRLLVAGFVLILIVVLTVPSVQARLTGENASESFDWRLDVWDASLSILKKPTLLGSGLDTSPILINQLLPRFLTPPHNDYFKVTMEVGLAGVFVFGLLQISFLTLGWKAFRSTQPSRSFLGLTILAITMSGLVISLSDNYLSYTSVQWYYWALIALCIAPTSKAGSVFGHSFMMKSE